MSLVQNRDTYKTDYNMLLMIKDVPTRIRDGVFDRGLTTSHLPWVWVPFGPWLPLGSHLWVYLRNFLVYHQEYWVIVDIR